VSLKANVVEWEGIDVRMRNGIGLRCSQMVGYGEPPGGDTLAGRLFFFLILRSKILLG
jgi:hypothetical protein